MEVVIFLTLLGMAVKMQGSDRFGERNKKTLSIFTVVKVTDTNNIVKSKHLANAKAGL